MNWSIKELAKFKDTIDIISRIRLMLCEVEINEIKGKVWKEEIEKSINKVDDILGDLQLGMISRFAEELKKLKGEKK